MNNQKGSKDGRDHWTREPNSPPSGKLKLGETKSVPTNYTKPNRSPSTPKEPDNEKTSAHRTTALRHHKDLSISSPYRSSSSPKSPSTPRESCTPPKEKEDREIKLKLLHQIVETSKVFLRVVELKDFDKTPSGRKLIAEKLFAIDYIHLRGYIPISFRPIDWEAHEGYLSLDLVSPHKKFQIQWFDLETKIKFNMDSFQEQMDLLFFKHLKAKNHPIFNGIPMKGDEIYWNAGLLAFTLQNNIPQFLMGERHGKWHFVGGGCVELSTDGNLKETALREWNEETYGFFKEEDIKRQIQSGAFVLKCPENHFIGWIVKLTEVVNVTYLRSRAGELGLPKKLNEDLYFEKRQEKRYAQEYTQFALYNMEEIYKFPCIDEKQQKAWRDHDEDIKKWMDSNPM